MSKDNNERIALVSFFEASEGKGWRNRQKWQSKDSFLPLGTLYGVSTANENGTVLRLDLASNSLSGKLSPAVGELTSLEVLDLSRNQIRGHLPEALAKLKSLKECNLSLNEFGGRLPRAFASINLPELEKLDVSSNRLSYMFVERLCSLTTLTLLNLNKNEFGGDVPGQLAALSNLTTLNLGCNDFLGSFPDFIPTHMTALQVLDLSINHFVGMLPESMSTLVNLTHLNLSGNDFHGELPRRALRLMSNLVTCDFSDNKFTGTLPTCFYRHKQLIRLDLSDNRLEGVVPPNFIALTGKLDSQCEVKIRDNGNFTMPPTIGILRTGLERLDMAHSQLVGSIPDDFGGLSRLQEIYLNNNKLEGPIPFLLANPGTMCHLRTIDLSNNQLSGDIPESFSSLTVLSHLNLSNNELSGNFHRSFRNLVALGTFDRRGTRLALSQNRFRSWVPESSLEMHTVLTLIRTIHAIHLAGHDPIACSNASDPRTCWYKCHLGGRGDQREVCVDLRASPEHLAWIGDCGVALATGLRLADRLVEVDIRGHVLGESSTLCLSESLLQNVSVQALWCDYPLLNFDLRHVDALWGLDTMVLDDSVHTRRVLCNLIRARPDLLHSYKTLGPLETTPAVVDSGEGATAERGGQHEDEGCAVRRGRGEEGQSWSFAILCKEGSASIYRPRIHAVVVASFVRAFYEEKNCFRYASALKIHGHQLWMALLMNKSHEMQENLTTKLCRLIAHYGESLAFVADDTEDMHRSIEQCPPVLHRRLVDSLLWFGRYYVPHKHSLPLHRSKKAVVFNAEDMLDTDPVSGHYRQVAVKLTTSRSR